MRQAFVLCLAMCAPLQAAWAGCAPVAMQAPRIDVPRIWHAAASDDTVEISFLGHASFEIVSPAGVSAVTDYNGINVPSDPPDIATMNRAHSTHYTLNPDPRIPHVLHGWAEDGKMPVVDLTVQDMHVTNLPTNIRAGDGGTERYGNSVFVFETGGLCIAHLSHLHHLLQPADIDEQSCAQVAVEGGFTLGLRQPTEAHEVVALDSIEIVLRLRIDHAEHRVSVGFAVDMCDAPIVADDVDLLRMLLPARTFARRRARRDDSGDAQ